MNDTPRGCLRNKMKNDVSSFDSLSRKSCRARLQISRDPEFSEKAIYHLTEPLVFEPSQKCLFASYLSRRKSMLTGRLFSEQKKTSRKTRRRKT